jgi:2-(1,2-epoxy-1,2-dihydrophenyl)acetyl-CoA isomerase
MKRWTVWWQSPLCLWGQPSDRSSTECNDRDWARVAVPSTCRKVSNHRTMVSSESEHGGRTEASVRHRPGRAQGGVLFLVTDVDTGTDDLLATVEDGVATITLNRPARRNATSPAMMDAFARTLARLRASDEVGCVVLTGAGGAFCAGGDVKAMYIGDDLAYEERVEAQRQRHRSVTLALWEMPMPTIAAIGGAAAGAGLSFAMTCDLRYAVPSAVVTTAFSRVALTGDHGISWLLTQLVGTAKARQLMYFSERIGALEAERIGLIHEILDEPRFMDEVMARAHRLANGPRGALSLIKDNLGRALVDGLDECLDAEAANQGRNFDTPDHHEAVRAFREKREPLFQRP